MIQGRYDMRLYIIDVWIFVLSDPIANLDRYEFLFSWFNCKFGLRNKFGPQFSDSATLYKLVIHSFSKEPTHSNLPFERNIILYIFLSILDDFIWLSIKFCRFVIHSAMSIYCSRAEKHFHGDKIEYNQYQNIFLQFKLFASEVSNNRRSNLEILANYRRISQSGSEDIWFSFR